MSEVTSKHESGDSDHPKSGSANRAPEPIQDRLDPDDELHISEWLAAYDEVLAQGTTDPSLEMEPPPVLAHRIAELEETTACLHLLEQLWPRTGSGHVPAEPFQAYSETGQDAPLSQMADKQKGFGRRLGRFHIIRELGRGGGGIVYLAFDPKLGRQVAIKVPQPEVVYTPHLRRRFIREARLVAQLNHPHVVPVYETAEAGPICYIVSAFCGTLTLAKWLQHRDASVPGKTAAQWIALLADAVEYAHRHGILHRDLKPSNILLVTRDPNHISRAESSVNMARSCDLDELSPNLIDFGLAKALDPADNVTKTGTVLGTPAYMAPEQAEGRLHDIGRETDVYALGAILYELLTGAPPFQGENELRTLQNVSCQEPKRPRRLQAKVPRELEAICLKCLEKPVGLRYASANDLAIDLRRFLQGQPTQARPISAARRGLRIMRRHPTLAGLMTVCLLSITSAIAGSIWHSMTLTHAENRTRQTWQESQQIRERVQRYEYAGLIQNAYRAWQNTDIRGALRLLDDGRPEPGQVDLRGFEWYLIKRLCEGGLKILKGSGVALLSASLSPDAMWLACGGEDGSLQVWNTSTGHRLTPMAAHQGPVVASTFSPDGHVLATAGRDGKIKVWDARTRQLKKVLEGHTVAVNCLEFAPDGKNLASGSDDATIRIWSVSEGRALQIIRGHTGAVQCVAFSVQGDRLASAGADKTVRIWELASPTHASLTIEPQNDVFAVAFSPDGRLLATGGGLLHLWDLSQDAPPIMLGGHKNYIRSLVFSPDGRAMATAGDDLTIRIWDLSSHETRHIFRAHTRSVYGLAWAPDGRLLASASRDGTARLWEPNSPQDRRRLTGPFAQDPFHLTYSHGQNALAAASKNEVSIWQEENGWRRVGSFSGPSERNVTSIAISPDDMSLAVSLHGCTLMVWNRGSDTDPVEISGTPHTPASCTFFPDGQRLAVADTGEDPKSIQVWDIQSQSLLYELPGRYCVAVSPDGRLIATESITDSFAVQLWDAVSRQSVAVLKGHNGHLSRVAFSPDGRMLASASHDGSARLWDVANTQPAFSLRGHVEGVSQVVFTADGERLATAGTDGTVKLWDTVVGCLVLSLPVSDEGVRSVSFAADAETLAVSSRHRGEERVDLWYAPREH